jgi:hypothetical protein
VARLIHDELGLEITRNLDQTRDGGHDLIGVPGWAIEVKRYKEHNASLVKAWWMQAVDQAAAVGQEPVVFYRLDRKPWRVLMRFGDIELFGKYDLRGVVECDPELWFALVREQLNEGNV